MDKVAKKGIARKCLMMLACGFVVIAVTALATGMIVLVTVIITHDQIMETLMVKTWEFQTFDCEHLTVRLIASATDGGWGKDVVTAQVYDKHKNLLAKSFVIKSFAKREYMNEKYVFTTNPKCTFMVVTENESSKVALMMYDDETKTIWPFHDGHGGNDQDRINDLKLRFFKKAKDTFNVDYE